MNQEDKAIAVAIENSKMISRDENSKSNVVELVGAWRAFIGIPKTDAAEELALCAVFIVENYDFLTYDEVKLAIKLSVLRKLKDCEFFGYFSPMYIAKVLDAYLYYRKLTLADAVKSRDRYILDVQEKSQKPTPEMQAQNFREIMQTFYETYKKNGEIRDVFSLSYNFLRKKKLLIVTEEMIAASLEYAKTKIAELKVKSMNEGKKLDIDVSLDEKRWARDYCVQKYFDKVDIDTLLSHIKPEDFN